jgi:stage V sporulation protein S
MAVPKSSARPDFDIEADTHEERILRVRNTSNPHSVASALSHALYANKKVILRAIGAGAVNQAIKSCAIARGFTAPRGFDLAFVPSFKTVTMGDGEELSAIELTPVVR